MKATGNSRIVFSLTTLRPSLCCRLAKRARPSSESGANSRCGRDRAPRARRRSRRPRAARAPAARDRDRRRRSAPRRATTGASSRRASGAARGCRRTSIRRSSPRAAPASAASRRPAGSTIARDRTDRACPRRAPALPRARPRRSAPRNPSAVGNPPRLRIADHAAAPCGPRRRPRLRPAPSRPGAATRRRAIPR